ncbi:MAG: DUF2062 domain-containing protein [Desulfobacteraceae bacterium]|nr:DUF2062 domain-containing protein [Desulfobacteraceae bacterium]
MNFRRQIRYFYVKFIRMSGDPHELALGMALGIFTGMIPIMPFHMALAVTLALVFKASKVAAALGTWINNPLDMYFLYTLNYRLGALILGHTEKSWVFSSVMESIQHGEEIKVIVGKIAGASGIIITSLLVGGFVMGVVFSLPSYFIFLRLFRFIKIWRNQRRDREHWRKQNQ